MNIEKPLGHWETIGKQLDDQGETYTQRQEPPWVALAAGLEAAAEKYNANIADVTPWQKAGMRVDRAISRHVRENPPPQKIYGTLTETDSKYFEIVLVRANNMLLAAEGVNAAQYSHGINATKSEIRWQLKQLEERPPTSWSNDRARIEKLGDTTMKLGGYLHCLKTGL